MRKKVSLLAGTAAANLFLALFWFVPALISFTYLYYLWVAYTYLYIFGKGTSIFQSLLFIIPLLLVECAATCFFEVQRHGWKRHVLWGFAGRLLFLFFVGLAVLCYPIGVKDAPNVFAPLLWRAHEIAKICWQASPLAAVFLFSALVFIYHKLVFRKRLLRFTATIFLPAAATAYLFSLLYFTPLDILHNLKKKPLAAVEKIFPRGEGKSLWFPHDLYVHPDDKWLAVSLGPTFRIERENEPNFLWLDIGSGRSEVFYGSQVRRFSSSCPEKIFFAPWHGSSLREYIPGTSHFREVKLPSRINGKPVREIFSVFHDCARGLVYAASNINPGIFVYDVNKQEVKRVVELSGKDGIWPSTHIFVVKPNHSRKSLFLSMYTEYPLAELDEKTFRLKSRSDCTWKVRNAFFDFAFSPDGKFVYAPAIFRGILFKFDARTLEVVKRIKIPPHSRSIKFSTDGKYLFLASYLDGEILVYDGLRERKVFSFYITPRVEALQTTKKYLYVVGARLGF